MDEQIKDKKVETTAEKKTLWSKKFLDSQRIVFGKSYLTLSVGIANPADSKGDPCFDITLSCGKKNKLHLYINSYETYHQLLKNLAEACDYFNHDETFHSKLEAILKEAWEIRNKDMALPKAKLIENELKLAF